MGSYASLSIGGYELFQTKSYVDLVAMSVFAERDRVVGLVGEDGGQTNEPMPIPPHWTRGDLDELSDETRVLITYRASSRAVAERLEAMGISLARLRATFEQRLRRRADEIEGAMEDDDVSRRALAEMLRQATFLDWSSAFQEMMSSDIHPAWPFRTPESLRTEMMRFIAEEAEDGESFFGLPGDARWLLRAATEVCGPDVTVEYDISELVMAGWYDLHQPVADEAIAALRREALHNAPTIVLTEGSTDAASLDAAIRLLAPHLTGYLTFLDFHTANAAGGTGPLIAAVRAFAAAGVLNRTIALFDNDTAGRGALRALERTRLPDSMRAIKLPDLPLAEHYPAIGPSGAVLSDVNGRAASLELYFGDDILRGEDGELAPVRWLSHDGTVGDWQGELLEKPRLQEAFKQKVRRALQDPSLLESLDWSGMRLIIDRVLRAFAEPREVEPPWVSPRNAGGNASEASAVHLPGRRPK